MAEVGLKWELLKCSYSTACSNVSSFIKLYIPVARKCIYLRVADPEKGDKRVGGERQCISLVVLYRICT